MTVVTTATCVGTVLRKLVEGNVLLNSHDAIYDIFIIYFRCNSPGYISTRFKVLIIEFVLRDAALV